MQSLKDLESQKPVVPPIISMVVIILGGFLMGSSEETFYRTFVPGYLILLLLLLCALVFTPLLYKLVTGKKKWQFRYAIIPFMVGTVGIGGILVYGLLKINFDQAANEKTVQLPIISQGTSTGKSTKTYYIEVNYEGQQTALTVDQLPGNEVKFVSAQVKKGALGFNVIERFALLKP